MVWVSPLSSSGPALLIHQLSACPLERGFLPRESGHLPRKQGPLPERSWLLGAGGTPPVPPSPGDSPDFPSPPSHHGSGEAPPSPLPPPHVCFLTPDNDSEITGVLCRPRGCAHSEPQGAGVWGCQAAKLGLRCRGDLSSGICRNPQNRRGQQEGGSRCQLRALISDDTAARARGGQPRVHHTMQGARGPVRQGRDSAACPAPRL